MRRIPRSSFFYVPIGAAFVTLSISLAVPEQDSGPPAALRWRLQQLHRDHNEGAAIGDINRDGKPDISAGEYWYPAPEFAKKKLRQISAFGKDYLQNNGEHLHDMNGDGLLDVVTGRFTETKVFWYENPGPGNYDGEAAWTEHLLVDTKTNRNEINFFHDIDGDAVPEWIENSWGDDNPMLLWRQVREEGNPVPRLKRHVVGEDRNGHGMGFGDINGDGRQDIVFKQGWFEQPEAGAFSGPWTHHADFVIPNACCPLIVVDLNRDGRNDLIWANGHGYGIYWKEQLEPKADGSTRWRQHLIDDKLAQAHALAWEDIDNDGEPELITGKRYFAHSGKDPGAKDPNQVVYYDFDPAKQTFTRHLIAEAPSGKGPGIGLQIRIADLDGNGWKDIVVPGKSGTYILWNEGRGDGSK